jgi:hypothetical protein
MLFRSTVTKRWSAHLTLPSEGKGRVGCAIQNKNYELVCH